MLISDTGKAVGAAIAAVVIYIGSFGFAWWTSRRNDRVQDRNAGSEWHPLASHNASQVDGFYDPTTQRAAEVYGMDHQERR